MLVCAILRLSLRALWIIVGSSSLVQVVEGGKGWGSYFCSSSRSMALASIDPSLALGFYCASTGAAQACCVL